MVDGADGFAGSARVVGSRRNAEPVLFVGDDSSRDGCAVFARLSDRPS